MTEDSHRPELFVGGEPPSGSSFIASVENGVEYFSGTTIRVLRIPYILNARGLHVPFDTSNPATQFFGVYVTIGEYANYFGSQWTRVIASKVASDLASSVPREVLVRGLGSLRRELEMDPTCASAFEEYCDFLGVIHAQVLRNILRSSQPRRVFLTRQLIVQSLNLVMKQDFKEMARHSETEDRDRSIMICHLVAESFGSEELPKGDIVFGTEEFDQVALSFLANQFFNAQDDRLVAIARSRKLWKSKSVRAISALKDLSPEDLFLATIGTPIDVQIAAALLVVGAVGPGSSASHFMKVNHEKWGSQLQDFLERVSMPLDISPTDVSTPKSEWDIGNFLSRPCVRIGESEIVVSDAGLLLERVTNGMFDEVNARMVELEISGNLNSAWGHVIEDYVRERLVPPLIDRGVRAIGEQEFQDCYRTTFKKLPDLILDFGREVVVIEVMKGGLSSSTILSQDVVQFRRNLEERLFKKARQLSNVISVIHTNPDAMFPDGTQRHFIPVIVSGDKLSQSFVVASYLRELDRAEALFNADVSYIPVCLDLGEIEFSEALIEQGVDFIEILKSWMTSGLKDVPLKNFLIDTFGSGKYLLRSTSLENEFKMSIREIFREFGWAEEELPTSH